jgi:hypothetical protein
MAEWTANVAFRRDAVGARSSGWGGIEVPLPNFFKQGTDGTDVKP